MTKQGPVYAGAIADIRADMLDFRDSLYRPTLVEVPLEIRLQDYRKLKVPILDQGRNNGCTGFTLATVAHYLLRKRKVVPDETRVSQAMLYAMARRYDEYPGEADSKGSSLRGAMKGWNKHGVCSAGLWPWDPNDLSVKLSRERAEDAALRPLGSYHRVNHRDIGAMHNALAEVGILAASAHVPFGGWFYGTTKDGIIPRVDTSNPFIGPWGGHAFAIVGYDDEGFWLQNSWGEKWGKRGYGRIWYDDWLGYGMDVWVARLGAPVRLSMTHDHKTRRAARRSFADLRPHFVSIDYHGCLQRRGIYGTTQEDVQAIIEEDFPRTTRRWKKRRLLLLAGGGLMQETDAIDRLSELRPRLLQQEIYPLALVWEANHKARLIEVLQRATEHHLNPAHDAKAFGFMLDRRDDAIEPLARRLGGKAEWDRIKLAASDACVDGDNGGVRVAIERLAAVMEGDKRVELHLIGCSIGALLLAPIVQLLTSPKEPITSGPLHGQKGLGLPLASLQLAAPACTMEVFKESFLPPIASGRIGRFALYTLTAEAEIEDEFSIYGRSLLYLVSNAFELRPRAPGGQGVPMVGMERCLRDPAFKDVLEKIGASWIKCPNTAAPPHGSTAHRHEDFENDETTRRSMLAFVLGVTSSGTAPSPAPSSSGGRASPR